MLATNRPDIRRESMLPGVKASRDTQYIRHYDPISTRAPRSRPAQNTLPFFVPPDLDLYRFTTVSASKTTAPEPSNIENGPRPSSSCANASCVIVRVFGLIEAEPDAIFMSATALNTSESIGLFSSYA